MWFWYYFTGSLLCCKDDFCNSSGGREGFAPEKYIAVLRASNGRSPTIKKWIGSSKESFISIIFLVNIQILGQSWAVCLKEHQSVRNPELWYFCFIYVSDGCTFNLEILSPTPLHMLWNNKFELLLLSLLEFLQGHHWYLDCFRHKSLLICRSCSINYCEQLP